MRQHFVSMVKAQQNIIPNGNSIDNRIDITNGNNMQVKSEPEQPNLHSFQQMYSNLQTPTTHVHHYQSSQQHKSSTSTPSSSTSFNVYPDFFNSNPNNSSFQLNPFNNYYKNSSTTYGHSPSSLLLPSTSSLSTGVSSTNNSNPPSGSSNSSSSPIGQLSSKLLDYQISSPTNTTSNTSSILSTLTMQQQSITSNDPMNTDNNTRITSIYSYNHQYLTSNYDINSTHNIPEILTKLIESDQAYRVQDLFSLHYRWIFFCF